MYQLHTQHLDIASGMHVIELRDERGNRHLLQIAVGHDACPACGHVHAKDILGDPKASMAAVVEQLDKSQASMLAYAQEHGLAVK
jgi:hypothetical protein